MIKKDRTLVPADASVEPDPEPPPLDWSIPLTDEVRAVVDKLCRSAAADPPAAVATVLAVLADPSPAPSPAPGVAPPAWRERERWQVVFTDVARLGAQALAKTSAFTSGVRSDDGISGEIERVLQASPSLPDLDAAEALLAPFSVTPRAVVERYLDRWGTLGRAVPPGTAAPYLARHAAATVDVLRSEGHARHDRPRLFQALAAVPVLPDLLVRALFDIALASATTEHEPARKALAGLPGKGTRLVAALTDSRADVRRSAAAWLGELGEDAGPEAAPALLKACRKEKQDAAKAAMLGALQALGVPAEQVLDLQALEKEAAKTASAALPSPDWLRWDDAPPVRWAAAHGGRPVSPDVVRLVLAKAVRAKSAEPDALLRFWCAAWDPVDRLALGEWLLQAWVGADLTPISPTQARHMAEDDVGYHRYQINQALAAGRIHPWANLTDAEVVEALLPSTSRTPAGSAIASKGLLAVVAACGAGSPAYTAIVRRYLTDWYGLRSAQCRALLAMLAWVDHPSGTALLLEVANRFRTRGIQDEAGRLVRELAVRKGWTVDELADRTMPTAGLAEDATLVLEYGPRQFTAFLRADLTLGLRDGDGRELKALPAPRASDDAEASAAAKKAFAGAKKEVAATVKQQTSRLEEALCTGRSWAFEDWQRFLLGHPVARQSVQRLVWMQVGEPDDGEPSTVAVFRPLDDGSLTDAEDEAVVVPPQARVVLAHDAFLDPATVQAWTTHLADYGVVPPFPQLGAGFWRLPADRAGEQALTDFEGHMVEAFALRGRATKLGWTRGDSGDGGVLYDYRKRFPTAGLDAVLEFSGNQLPEENLPVAILSLAFDTIAPGGGGLRKPLGAVPPVLLSRCRADVEAIAAAGTGFDPDWEKVTNR